jgi:esterase/lipase superfamily enzyme
VILAAPDFAASEFSQLALAFPKIAGRTTLYASGKDKPLQLSGFLSTYPRAGYVPPVTIVPGIDTVEVSNIDLSFVGHNYAMELRPLLADMFQLITMGKGADERFGLIEALTDQKQKYWKLRK